MRAVLILSWRLMIVSGRDKQRHSLVLVGRPLCADAVVLRKELLLERRRLDRRGLNNDSAVHCVVNSRTCGTGVCERRAIPK